MSKNALGERYPDQSTPRVYICQECGAAIEGSTKKAWVVCLSCRTKRHNRQSNENMKKKFRDPDYAFRNRIRRFGLTLEWYESQPKACGICFATEPRGKGGWHIDHDHACCVKGCPSCIRGLLCHSCNVGLGHFRDDPSRLLAAAAWVSRV